MVTRFPAEPESGVTDEITGLVGVDATATEKRPALVGEERSVQLVPPLTVHRITPLAPTANPVSWVAKVTPDRFEEVELAAG